MRLIEADKLKDTECRLCAFCLEDSKGHKDIDGCREMGCGVMDTIDSQPTVVAIQVEDVAGMLAFAHNGKLPCDLEWYECKVKPCTNGDKSCWLQALVEGELEE